MASPQAIDSLPVEPRHVEMQVLCLGLSRTATMSMWAALTKLGYKTYHFKEVGQTDLPNENHVACWREAFNAKMYGIGKAYGKEEFDRLLRRYSAVTDAPCVCFSDELIATYPSAKVILTNRDPKKWLASMETAYYRILASADWRWFRALCCLDLDFLDVYIDLLRMPLRFWTGEDWLNRTKLLRTFDSHYNHIRSVVPPERLLEWSPEDGWEPICSFLGQPKPNEPFPYINKGDNAAQIHKKIAYMRALAILKQLISDHLIITTVVLILATTVVTHTGWSLVSTF